jgi:hypothetical protein
MATFKTISSADIKTTKTTLNQLIDFVEEDISGSSTRKKYQVFVTGATGPVGNTNAVTSSLFHTIFDQDYTLQTANEIFDMTVGVYYDSATAVSSSTGTDINGKVLYPSQSLMMREKINIYRQFSQLLLGNATTQFTAPFSNPAASGRDSINEALFICFKRLFVRDGIKRETFAMKFFPSSSAGHTTDVNGSNITVTTANPATGSYIFTDVGSAAAIERSQTGGDVGNIVLASNTAETVGLLFYQQGIAVLDLAKVLNGNQVMTGSVACVGDVSSETLSGSFIPNFMVSGSVDEILNHIAETRFSSGSSTFLTFQNNTRINSTLYFCRATADEFNFSTNPTYTDSNGRIIVIDESEQGTQKSFSFITTVGLYDTNEELLAVAKLSRPVEKNDEKDMTFRVRLDF